MLPARGCNPSPATRMHTAAFLQASGRADMSPPAVAGEPCRRQCRVDRHLRFSRAIRRQPCSCRPSIGHHYGCIRPQRRHGHRGDARPRLGARGRSGCFLGPAGQLSKPSRGAQDSPAQPSRPSSLVCTPWCVPNCGIVPSFSEYSEVLESRASELFLAEAVFSGY